MPTETIKISEQQAEFIRQSMNGGHYRDVSEVIGAGLRLLAQREEEDKLKLVALRRIASQSFEQIDNGQFSAVDPAGIDDFLSGLNGKGPSTSRR